jgi:hypothetical protein
MVPTSTALVVSDFPIVAETVNIVFRDRYRIVVRTWNSYVEHPQVDAELVIVDVTTVERDIALALVARMLPRARVVVCSLHRNEVEVYRIDPSGVQTEGAFPSLLSLRSSA